MPKAQFTKFEKSTCWVAGTCNGVPFEAMLMDQDCEQGIMKGRVLELIIADVAFYRFGWLIEPPKDIFNPIMHLLHTAPKRFY